MKKVAFLLKKSRETLLDTSRTTYQPRKVIICVMKCDGCMSRDTGSGVAARFLFLSGVTREWYAGYNIGREQVD